MSVRKLPYYAQMRASPTITRDRVTIHDPASAGDPKNSTLPYKCKNLKPKIENEKPYQIFFLSSFATTQGLLVHSLLSQSMINNYSGVGQAGCAGRVALQAKMCFHI